MGTKMKGLLKGLKQFSDRFEEKEEEMQIGLPTDVKHVAHIGWDGPSLESPSWMKQYRRGGAAQSAPLGFSGLPVENSEKKWVSQDSLRKKSIKASARDLPELPKSSRRQSADSPATSPSPIRDPSKLRSSRRHLQKESDGSSSRGSRRTKELSTDAPDQTDIPKKTRRKKSKNSSVRRSSKSKDKDKELSVNGVSVDSLLPTSFSDPFSEPGSDNIDLVTRSAGNEVLPASKLKPFVPEVEKASVAVVA